MFKILLIFLLLSFSLKAEDSRGGGDGLWKKWSNEFSEVWNNGTSDLFVPVNTWHNREMYDSAKTRKYNEKPWGIGFGKSIKDDDITRELFAMEFQDSHNYPELVAGYNYFKNYHLWDDGFRVSPGLCFGFTIRKDYSLPAIIPLLSLGYKWFSVEATYIPGGYNSNNVLFSWVRISF